MMRRIWTAALIAIATLTLGAAAFAQTDYPSKPIRVIVPYPAGGSTDVLARTIGEKLTEAWGQPIVIDNKSGASGIIGVEAGVRAAPDGYTLTLGTNQTHAANAVLFDKLPFDLLRDVQPVALAATSRHVIVVPAGSSIKTLTQLVERKAKLSYASSGAGSASHLISEALRAKTGMDAVHVPYRGASPAVTDLLSGQVDFMTATYASVSQYIDSGKLRALAIGGEARIPQLPNVPSLREAGFEKINADAWFAFYAPAGTPRPIADKLNQEIGQAVKDANVVAKLRSIGFEPVTMSVDEFAKFHRAELARWSEMVRLGGVKLTQ